MRVGNLAELRNSCSGDLFIIASGPSAGGFPLQRYSHLPMIAVNGSIRLFTDAGVTPYFYLCDDSSFVRNRLSLLMEAVESAQHLALSPRVIKNLIERVPNALDGRSIFRFQRVNRLAGEQAAFSDRRFAWRARRDRDLECQFSLFQQKPNRIGFSRNLEKGYFSNRTVPYAGVQLAYHLGFTRVFMVGLDLSSSAGRFYEQGKDAVPSRLDSDYEDYILPCFRLMSERVTGSKFQVFNLSSGSRLPETIVPKIDFNELDQLLACS
ncbi:lipopolysaccharide core biosynthesis protein [Pseudomonas sp. PDM11]|uniref:lipopolysaccharide core biosynthesis protein n=1 Tax=Pseudomonas sp. PDM11 TaxID=2769309 RepID=UPI0017866397|nr:lipopolysaccharide core biosynthesis protein [Pseudomonas sp. PDM11]MBD9398833.1 lipopolysaccharide core biosynthesis protein [Pseudomonas sp. PDM11]